MHLFQIQEQEWGRVDLMTLNGSFLEAQAIMQSAIMIYGSSRQRGSIDGNLSCMDRKKFSQGLDIVLHYPLRINYLLWAAVLDRIISSNFAQLIWIHRHRLMQAKRNL